MVEDESCCRNAQASTGVSSVFSTSASAVASAAGAAGSSAAAGVEVPLVDDEALDLASAWAIFFSTAATLSLVTRAW